MPTFDFSISKRKEVKSKKTYTTSEYSILESSVTGVVYITLDACYNVKVNDINYSIMSKNFSCKGVSKVYRQLLDNNKQRVLYVRLDDNKCELGHNLYLPFAPGCVVIGNILEHTKFKYKIFDIKKVLIDYDNVESQEAIKFYRDNYDVIQEKLILKYE